MAISCHKRPSDKLTWIMTAGTIYPLRSTECKKIRYKETDGEPFHLENLE